jgi:hypothetical protein
MAKGRRRSKPYSYTPTLERGEYQPRCNVCGVVVPTRLWWEHTCQKENQSGSDTSSRDQSSVDLSIGPTK